ncbi:unnamed protein product [Didymodactylos carnosus]|uniref:Uncharacterized protein n=1 Tax=Didymodactylos carnosus TaxID=1234261 RepID=A0A8S2GAU2_9BILA|nr:unnamed protein product [Didymodactylos carnosus]CAF4537350.1 unnamed protein product [Didymodactylos carnosus]
MHFIYGIPICPLCPLYSEKSISDTQDNDDRRTLEKITLFSKKLRGRFTKTTNIDEHEGTDEEFDEISLDIEEPVSNLLKKKCT